MCWRRCARHGWPARRLSAIARAIAKFKAVEHRLEFVATINGVEYLQRLEGHQRGRDGEGDCGVSGRGSPDSRRQGQGCGLCAACTAAAGAGARGLHHRRGGGKIESQLRGSGADQSCETLATAVSAAAAAARPGEVVLLAPACSSFDQFENYEQRGRVFKQLVNEQRDWKVGQNA